MIGIINLKKNKMKTPHLDIEIKNLENLSLKKELTGLAKDALAEYKAMLVDVIRLPKQKDFVRKMKLFIVSISKVLLT
jgi:hypothetical protein